MISHGVFGVALVSRDDLAIHVVLLEPGAGHVAVLGRPGAREAVLLAGDGAGALDERGALEVLEGHGVAGGLGEGAAVGGGGGAHQRGVLVEQGHLLAAAPHQEEHRAHQEERPDGQHPADQTDVRLAVNCCGQNKHCNQRGSRYVDLPRLENSNTQHLT